MPETETKTKPKRAERSGRDLLTVELSPDVRAALSRLCEREAERTGSNPARQAGPLVRRLILDAARKAGSATT